MAKRFADIKSQAPVSAETKRAPISKTLPKTPAFRFPNYVGSTISPRSNSLVDWRSRNHQSLKSNGAKVQQSRRCVVTLKRSVRISKSPQSSTTDAESSSTCSEARHPTQSDSGRSRVGSLRNTGCSIERRMGAWSPLFREQATSSGPKTMGSESVRESRWQHRRHVFERPNGRRTRRLRGVPEGSGCRGIRRQRAG